MGYAKSYFSTEPLDPAPLVVNTRRRVRFEEVDMLRIVWHGHYVSFLDDGRVALGDRYPTLSYQKLMEEEVAAPIVQMHLDYQGPLVFDEEMQIETSLFWSDALKLNFTYRISGADGRLAVHAYTVQLFTDLTGQVLLVAPDWLEDFRQQWRSGVLL
jgi:acyl-CoA thioester hydrolase